jgi:hypothetical protein
VTAALAAATLAIGVAVGAAIGPAPSPSFAVSRLLALLPAPAGAGAPSATHASQPRVTPEATAARASEAGAGAATREASGEASPSTAGAPSSPAPRSSSRARARTPSAKTPTGAGETGPATLARVSKVWLIELSGSSFGEAAAQPSAAPYIEGQALAAGTLLSGWSALDASDFAGDAALVAGAAPQLLDTIVQPPCPAGAAPAGAAPAGAAPAGAAPEGAAPAGAAPEGAAPEGAAPEVAAGAGAAGESAAGAQCAANTPGALGAADAFLRGTLRTIVFSAAYRQEGLIVVTFASVATASATGLPAGAASATLTSQLPAGALLISPFVAAGAKSRAAFEPASPKRDLEKLLRR